MARKTIKDFETLYEDGPERSKPGGFCVQTTNGTSHWSTVGWNQTHLYPAPMATPGGAWKPKRSNRGGE